MSPFAPKLLAHTPLAQSALLLQALPTTASLSAVPDEPPVPALAPEVAFFLFESLPPHAASQTPKLSVSNQPSFVRSVMRAPVLRSAYRRTLEATNQMRPALFSYPARDRGCVSSQAAHHGNR